MSEYLYTGYSGHKVDHFSYTQASAIAKCGHAFDLERIRGWAKKKRGASMEFGTAIESAVRDMYLDGHDPIDGFSALWEAWRESEDLEYSDKDQDWDHLLAVGKALMKEFTTGKDSRYGFFRDLLSPETKFAVYLEKRNWCDWTTLDYTVDAFPANRIVDMKTSSKSYPDDPIATAMDNQLRTGCLVSGARKVAFLTFVKTKYPSVQWLPGDVRDEWVDDIDGWLRAQRAKVLNKEFFRTWGQRFPNQQCSMCDVRAVCTGDMATAAAELKQKTGREVVDLSFLDSI